MLFSLLFPLSTLAIVLVAAQDTPTTTPDTLHGDHYCGVHRHRQLPRNPVARCVNIPLPPGVELSAQPPQSGNEDEQENEQDDPNADQRDCVACKACWDDCRQQRNMQELQNCRRRIETALAEPNATCAKAMACFGDCRPKWSKGQSRPTVKAGCPRICCDDAALCVDDNNNNVMYDLLHSAWVQYNKQCDVPQCRTKCSEACGIQNSNNNEVITEEEEEESA